MRSGSSSSSGSAQRRTSAVLGDGSGLAQVTRTTNLDSAEFGGGASVAAWWRRRQERGAGASRPDSELSSRLSTELEAHAFDLMPREQHVKQKDEFLSRLQHTLSELVEGAEVAPFGSVVNGFWTPHSDVDISVRVPGASTRDSQIKTLRKIASELSKVETHNLEPRFGAHVPILHWAPRRPGMVSCDISVNNLLAVVNSRLVGHYVRLDERLRTLGLCLKAWAQARDINDRSRGTASSFSLVLMLIHFMQRRSPPALPSLQDIAFSRSMPQKFVNGVDCRYCADADEVKKEMEYLQGMKGPNKESVGTLMLDFFRHFGYEYRCGVIRIRDTRSVLPPKDESGDYLVVDNPFEVGKDVANIDSSQHEHMRKEFRRAWSLLSQGRSFQELLKGPDITEVTRYRVPGNERGFSA